MKRSDIKSMPEYFDRYINLVDDIELDTAFQNNLNTMAALDIPTLEKIGDKSYAEGKWTLKDVFQHMIDTERIFSYRTLRFARQDGVIPQGYDQNLFAANAKANKRTVKDLIEELKLVHQSSFMLFRSFDKETMMVTGTSWKVEMSVLAMGYLITGHIIHHMKVINEKYIPLGA